MNGMLDSQLVFYSDEKVISRWTNPLARYPAGHSDLHRRARRDGRESRSIFTVDGKYFVYVGADTELLKKLGFRFWDW